MHVRVIVPPEPIVEPSDVAGSHSGDDADVARIIMAAQRMIDGPNGWLGRAIGEQTLELTAPKGCELRLLFPPLIEIESVSYLDTLDAEQVVDDTAYRAINGRVWFRSGFAFPATSDAPDAVRVRYRAGYDGIEVENGGTGDIPAEAKQAVIILTQHMISTSTVNLFLREEQVDGIGTRQFTVSDQAGNLVERAVGSLLQGLRVYP